MFLPAVHAIHLAELAKRWNVTDLLVGAGEDEEALADPEARMEVPRFVELVERARALTGEPALGIFVGLHMRASAHGYLGFAAMTASTIREALDLACRYCPTRTDAFALRVNTFGDRAALVIEELADFGPARDGIVFALAIGIWQIGSALTGKELAGAADFAFEEPPYFKRFTRFAPTTRFAQATNQLLFDARLLDVPLTMADPSALRLARDQCERALAALGRDDHVAGRVRKLLFKPDGSARTVDETAAELHLSPRTLKRRLAAQGVAYSSLVEEAQKERALLLLRSPDLSIDAVAERLGYSDVAGFTKAFRRWTGTTPGAYRKR
jgi:AraC-like DNA-binding protein